MRKLLMGVAAMGMLFATSCQNDGLVTNGAEGNYTLTLDMDADSRTMMDENGECVWGEEEEIWVVGNGGDISGTLKLVSTSNRGKTAVFSGFVNGDPSELDFMVYPKPEGNKIQMRTIQGGSHNAPMVGKINNGNVEEIKYAGGLVKMHITGTDDLKVDAKKGNTIMTGGSYSFDPNTGGLTFDDNGSVVLIENVPVSGYLYIPVESDVENSSNTSDHVVVTVTIGEGQSANSTTFDANVKEGGVDATDAPSYGVDEDGELNPQTAVNTEEELREAVNEDGRIALAGPIILNENLIIPVGKKVTLDMNELGLTLKGNSIEVNGELSLVNKGTIIGTSDVLVLGNNAKVSIADDVKLITEGSKGRIRNMEGQGIVEAADLQDYIIYHEIVSGSFMNFIHLNDGEKYKNINACLLKGIFTVNNAEIGEYAKKDNSFDPSAYFDSGSEGEQFGMYVTRIELADGAELNVSNNSGDDAAAADMNRTSIGFRDIEVLGNARIVGNYDKLSMLYLNRHTTIHIQENSSLLLENVKVMTGNDPNDVERTALVTGGGTLILGEGTEVVLIENDPANGVTVKTKVQKLEDGKPLPIVSVWNEMNKYDDSWCHSEDAKEYHISTAAQLADFAMQVNGGRTFDGKTIHLTVDIDLNNIPWTPIGVKNTDGNFMGIFDGNNKMVKNLVVDEHEHAGLFGYIAGDKSGRYPEIKNVNVSNIDIKSNHYAGGVIGYALRVSLNGCSASGGNIVVTPEMNDNKKYDNGDKAGGVVGWIQLAVTNKGVARTKMTNCTARDLTITAYREFGGVAGWVKDTAATERQFRNNRAEDIILISNRSGYIKDYDEEKEMNAGALVGYYSSEYDLDASNTYTNVTVPNE